ncbi:MAG: hypothetical protein AB7G37_10835 [Solirubrobacteraceae bacterium]
MLDSRLRRAVLPLLATTVLAVSGCGDSDDDNGGAGGSTSSGDATVVTRDVPGYGTVLANDEGRPLYVYTKDPEGGSACTDACAETWPPLEAEGTPTTGGEVKAGLLATFEREDGTTQILYNQHALYTHTGGGLLEGVGEKLDGGTWYLISPNGETVETTEPGGY